ncbi:MAG: HAD family hydrolase [Planctomycetota bacterium]|nr:MAG: HAD family hydrolase [Planctomycetota bacterium]
MWSGPRNISTAMMRAWDARPDTYVCDEPLYAHYLQTTGLDHPGRDEIIAHHDPDWRRVVAWLTGPIPEGREVFYQKHMAHHLLPNIERGWLAELTHCFLIREPREMLTSLLKKYPSAGLADTGLPQQSEIVRFVQDRAGRTPPILDAREVLENPRGMLRALCQRLGLEFDECMLSWPAGPRPTDGIWAKYWYDAVVRTTSFQPYKPKNDELPARHTPLLRACHEHYDRLYEQRLTVAHESN